MIGVVFHIPILRRFYHCPSRILRPKGLIIISSINALSEFCCTYYVRSIDPRDADERGLPEKSIFRAKKPRLSGIMIIGFVCTGPGSFRPFDTDLKIVSRVQ